MGTVRTAVRVEGVVQGVGFRPFVYSLATGLGLTGLVGNDTDGVFAEVEGPQAAVTEFLRPARAGSAPAGQDREGHDPGNQPRPFGTILRHRRQHLRGPAPDAGLGRHRDLRGLPARTRRPGRPAATGTPSSTAPTAAPGSPSSATSPTTGRSTTMAPFAMCEACAAEYHDPADRRFHAQPVCCPACGPRLTLDGTAPKTRSTAAAATPPPRQDPRDQGPGRLPPGRRRRRRARRRRTPLPQAPRRQALRGHGRRPGRGEGTSRGRRRGRRPPDQPGPPDRPAAPAPGAPRSPQPPPPATASSASCSRTRRCTTCSSPPPPAPSS